MDIIFQLHKEMLEHILMSTMAFFDTTPIGRIINRDHCYQTFLSCLLVSDCVLSQLIIAKHC